MKLKRLSANLTLALAFLALPGCGSVLGSGGSSHQNSQYLSRLRDTDPEITHYRSPSQLVALGHAACEEMQSGVSYLEVADRMAGEESPPTLPSQDLGAVISSAARVFCPKYSSQVSG